MMEKLLVKKPEPTLSKTNKPVQKKPDVKKKNVRITDHNILMTILLNDPDALTTEEFLFLQSVVGFHQASIARQEGKKRKQQRKLQGMNPPLLEKPKLEGKPAAPGSSLPDNLRAGLEKLSGVELSDVKVHQNSHKPQQVGALAYTKGNDIHIAPGQEKYLPHEGWHAVQQKQGRVKPTLQMKAGELVNDDAGLEKEADVMGARALKEGLTDSTTKTAQLEKTFPIGQESKTVQRISQEEAMRIAKKNTHEENSGYSWSIRAGEYNRYVMEAQDMLRDIGYKLSKRGVDGKWSPGGETYNALMEFQKTCKETYNGLRQNAPAQVLAQVKYMQGVEPTGKLDKVTHNALTMEKEKKSGRLKEEKERANKKKIESENRNKAKAAAETAGQGNSDTDDVLDGIQTAIDVVGFVPGVGDIADGVNIGISIVRKDWLGAIFSGIALIPMVGSAIAAPIKAISKASKVGKAGKLGKIIADAIEFLIKFLGGANKVISKLSGYLEDLKGIFRKLPEVIKAAADSKLVKIIVGNKGIQKIISFAKKIGNGIETICKKADEVFIKVKNAVVTESTVKEAANAGASEVRAGKVFADEPISWTATRPKGTQQTYEVFQRNDINWDLNRTAGDKRFIGKTNAEAADAGIAPQLNDGNFATLHHLGQDSRGGLVEASTRYHGVGMYGQDILHSQYGKNVPHPEFPIDRQKFGIDTREYWKLRVTNR